MAMDEMTERYGVAEKAAAQSEGDGEVFDGLSYVEEANRDIAKAVADLEDRLRPVLRSAFAQPDGDPKDESRDWSPLRERLDVLNSSQHQIMRQISEIVQRLGV